MAPDDAWGLLLGQTCPLTDSPQPLALALGFCLAETIYADRDLPPADRAAMDGYAVQTAGLPPSAVLRVLGEVAAGHPAGPAVRPGACVRIFTGANLSPGADAVVRQEDTEPADERGAAVRLLQAVPPGANVFRQGENARAGDELLTPGTRLEAAALALCATVGRSVVRVFRRPAVGLLTTGSELLEAGAAAQPHQIRDSNGPFLRAALAEHRYVVAADARADDDPDRIVAALRGLAACSDVIVLTGGVSVGRYDFTAEAVRRAGAAIRFHGVAMKPGKPLLHAVDPAGRLIFGLPGNPVSAMVCFYEFVLPALHRLAGGPADRCRPMLTVRLAHDLKVKGDRQQHVPARLTWTPTGPEAAAVALRGTADVVAAARAAGALRVPAGTRAAPAGTFLAFRPWRMPW
ncbi:MAG: molybdopterin molybdotransferase MoeA [Kiritimatiellaeota bacterium]|nr:molybdopterin molybdotransferase MoeA [Kiritimatiellota bacterium]